MTSDQSLRIREMNREDLPFLRQMLIAALAWDPDRRLPAVDVVLAHPQVMVFHAEWGRSGDTALLAECDGEQAGLVWYRSFTVAAHGEGFVDADTPELVIAVRDGFRGRGIGRALMLAAHGAARRAGIARLSLSVDRDNPAKRLYQDLGYAEFEPDDGLGRMIIHLAARRCAS